MGAIIMIVYESTKQLFVEDVVQDRIEENIDRKLLEQLFSNMGFPINEKISDDTCLKEFYKTNDDYSGRFGIWIKKIL